MKCSSKQLEEITPWGTGNTIHKENPDGRRNKGKSRKTWSRGMWLKIWKKWESGPGEEMGIRTWRTNGQKLFGRLWSSKKHDIKDLFLCFFHTGTSCYLNAPHILKPVFPAFLTIFVKIKLNIQMILLFIQFWIKYNYYPC